MSIKTFVTGFPRIGKKRELIFAIESYFKGELAACELEKTSMRYYYNLYGKEVVDNTFGDYAKVVSASSFFIGRKQ